MWTNLSVGCVVSMVAGVVLTAVLRTWLPRFGLTDQPDGRRKTHRKLTPVGGGLAVFAAASVALCFVLATSPAWRETLHNTWTRYLGLWIACFLITILGLIDDAIQLRGRQKLMGQLVVCLVMIYCGIRINRIEIFGNELDFGIFAVPFTMLWFVGTINALNLLDGIDGLATSMGIIISTAIAIMALISGTLPVAMVCLLFASALMGFLILNFPPASIFLGDTGSMLIGTVIGALAIIGSFKTPGTVLLAAPLALFAVPFMDTMAAIVRRKLTGRSLYSPDRDHLHHRLTWRMSNSRTALACIAMICLLASLGGIVSVYLRNDVIAAITVFAIVTLLAALRVFGDSELKLVLQHTAVFGRSLWQPAEAQRRCSQHTAVRFRGTMPWDRFWESLTDAAGKLQLRRVSLNINLWALDEVYHAKWNDGTKYSSEEEWSVRLPLFVRAGQVGHISVTGLRDGQPMCAQLEMFLALIEPFEEDFQAWCEEAGGEPAAALHSVGGEVVSSSVSSRDWLSVEETGKME